MKRKSARRKKGIRTTISAPKWQRNLRAGVKGLKRELWNVLGGIGVVTVLYLLAKALGGG